MSHLRYFWLNAADVAACVTDAAPRHAEETGGNELSVTWNVAKTEALIKIEGCDKDWREGKAWVDAAIKVYDNDNKMDRFKDLNFYSDAWHEPTDDLNHGIKA